MPELPSYGRRLRAKAYKETARFIQHKLLTGACVAISVIFVRLALWHFHRLTLTWAEVLITLLTIIGSYGIVVLGAFAVNLFRAPVLLDRERIDEIAVVTDTLKQQADEIAALTKKNEALKQKQTVPEVSAQERRRREIVSLDAKQLGKMGRDILRYINDHGQVHATALDTRYGDTTVQKFVAIAVPRGLILYKDHISAYSLN